MAFTLRSRFPAMGAYFEAVLVGGDPGDEPHLSAVASALWEEVARVERLLSRFDPAAEVYRVNRDARHAAVKVGTELLDVLRACEQHRRETDGYFDVTLGTSGGPLEIDPHRRTVRLRAETAYLDFGGFGKGYALDRLAPILSDHGVASALVHGGTSSILAVGPGPDGAGWPVGVRDPFAAGDDAEATQVRLRDCAFSCSATLPAGATAAASDLVDPTRRRALAGQAACVVLAGSGAVAEAWSTALLAMGRERATRVLQERPPANLRAGWVDRGPAGAARLCWLS